MGSGVALQPERAGTGFVDWRIDGHEAGAAHALQCDVAVVSCTGQQAGTVDQACIARDDDVTVCIAQVRDALQINGAGASRLCEINAASIGPRTDFRIGDGIVDL